MLLLAVIGPARAAGEVPLRITPLDDPSAAAVIGCPADSARSQGRNWFSGSGAWRITIERGWRDQPGRMLVLDYPFGSEFRIHDNPDSPPLRRTKRGPDRDPSWPARLAVVALDDTLTDGTVIDICLRQTLGRAVAARVVEESSLRAEVRKNALLNGIALGGLGAMALAGVGMTLAIGSTTFLLISLGLAGAMLYLVTGHGTVYELPLLAMIADQWSLQRIGGNLSVLTLGLGLSRLVELPQRHPRINSLLRLALALVALLLLALLVPAISRADWPATVGNLLLIAVSILLFGTAARDALRGHRSSRKLLLAWSPPFLVAVALTVDVMTGASVSALIEALFPAALAVSSTALFFELADTIGRVRSERDRAERRADRDDLTGALARASFDQALFAARKRALSKNQALSALFIDLDRFKQINDEYGHAVGDRALVRVVGIIETCLRDGDRLGRYGGEEFVVLLEQVDAEGALEIAERVRERIANHGRPLQAKLPAMTVSIGIAELDRAYHESARSLIERADTALRWCKEHGRDQIRLAPVPNSSDR
ncbi:MAG: diguanylate cyclase [Wenzhouxiangellaceae bacterium]|nr:diguanylate cyclase [Wenzhouxiangellaceae bacterium]